MDLGFGLLSLLVGWCGTRWPRWWPFPVPPVPPGPDPWWRLGVLGAIGGVLGGFMMTELFVNEISVVTVSIGAFVVGRVLSDVIGPLVMPRH